MSSRRFDTLKASIGALYSGYVGSVLWKGYFF